MSRCFPYPPPGYERAPTRDEALIESIKLQREGEKAKKERRKEKKRDKKEKEKAGKNGEIENKKHSHKERHRDERSQEDQKGGDHQKRIENETEQFEKSSLTEEYGHPVGSQNLCNSSDSTLNSNKRQKHSSLPDGRHNPGSIIRIRLPLQRHKDPDVLLTSKEQPCSPLTMIVREKCEAAAPRSVSEWREHLCSTSRTTNQELAIKLGKEKPCSAFVQEKCEATPRPGSERREHPCSTSRTTDQELVIKLGKGKPCLTSQAFEFPADNVEATPVPSLYGSGSPPLELQFRNLLENWVPPPMQIVQADFDDEEWLFETKQNQSCAVRGPKASSDGLSCGNATPWPRGCYLPEANIYALPFTIPF